MIIYSEINKREFFSVPSLIRWRARHRGPRESFKINSEIAQTTYDIHKLYEKYDGIAGGVSTNLTVLSNGGTIGAITYTWEDGDTTDDLVVISGLDDLVLRLSILLKRVSDLEMGI